MRTFISRAAAIAAVALVLVACSNETPATTPVEGRFDSIHHLVLDNIANEGFETITVFVHLCTTEDETCPNGEEDMAPLVARHLLAGTTYLSSSEVFVEPPDRCLDHDMACRISIVRCEYATRADQLAAEFCAPSPEVIAAASAMTIERDDPNPCIDRREERSHHIDHGCVLEQVR